MTQPILQLINVKKTINKKDIIKGLNLSVYPGEVFGFLGPNGAGKTTTIRIIVGLMRATEGDIIIKGSSIKSDFNNAIKNIGGIIETPQLYPYLSGWKNLVHFARMSSGIDKSRIEEIVCLVGLENRIKDKVSRYSLGMRQRLGIAQALLHKPSILILDEPTNGLDPTGIREMRDYIRNLALKENVAVIVSSHLLSEMELMCDRIGVIQDGELKAIEYVNDLSTMRDIRRVGVEAEPIEDAYSIIQGIVAQTSIQIKDDHIFFEINRSDIPNLVTSLKEQDIKIYGINNHKYSLEERFHMLIGESKIV